MKENQVTIIRRLVADSEHGEELESISHLDDWQVEIEEYLIEHGDPIEEIFFSYDEQQTETEISIDGQSYNVYPVEADEKTLYFKKGKGLWMKEYQDELTKEMYDEDRKAIRIINKD